MQHAGSSLWLPGLVVHPGIKAASPTLQRGFLTTGSPRKSPAGFLYLVLSSLLILGINGDGCAEALALGEGISRKMSICSPGGRSSRFLSGLLWGQIAAGSS